MMGINRYQVQCNGLWNCGTGGTNISKLFFNGFSSQKILPKYIIKYKIYFKITINDYSTQYNMVMLF